MCKRKWKIQQLDNKKIISFGRCQYIEGTISTVEEAVTRQISKNHGDEWTLSKQGQGCIGGSMG